ncbi:MbnP family protein [Larkinella insperata]|uniref:MbnP family protein n=1 Tax=Larkinella insperata TaxID=332158 RepID=A0ABW3QBV5_9BACT|nr:MbnP family protein [Larkinella insperata]
MRNYLSLSIMSLFLFLTVLVACQKEPVEPNYGTVQLKFDNVVGSQELNLDNTTYTNGSGEPFVVTRLDYFVSNIKLKKADGSEYVVPQDSSYFLVSERSAASQTVSLRNIPAGDYTGITFVVGVDSLRNTMGIDKRTGALDPAGTASGMYWDWNSGYIFLKLEGTSTATQADATGKQNFTYHIGLFGGYQSRTINNLKTIQLPFEATPARVTADRTTGIQLKADVMKIFNGVKPLSIAKTPMIMVSALSADVAANYATMFSISNVQAD